MISHSQNDLGAAMSALLSPRFDSRADQIGPRVANACRLRRFCVAQALSRKDGSRPFVARFG